MKRTGFIIAMIVMALSSTSVFAQGKYGADSANCIKYLSFYKDYFKQKSYNEALPNWREAFKRCPPTANQTMLVDGTTLMRKLISQNSKNPVYREKLVDSLMMIHDIRIANYPKYAVTARNNKGLDLANYVQNDPERLYKEYGEIIAGNKTKTKPTILLFYFDSAVELYKNGSLDEEEIIGVYEGCMELLSKMDPKDAADKEMVDDMKLKIEELFASNNIADCDKLIELYTPKFEADPQNIELAEKIVRFMSAADGCTDNALFISAATSIHKSNPTHASAYTLYKLNASTGKSAEAVKYLQEAIDREDSDAAQDAEYYYELAVYNFKCGNNLAAEQAAKKVIPLATTSEIKGKTYMLIGTIWGGVRCDGNDIAKRAPYWVAVDYFERAKAADPELAAEANKRINEYKKYYPLTADAFMFGVNDGETYQVSCGGFKANTTVRTQN
ncbi:MAG: hypothetical protein UD286_04270 [Bacteroidales bacterium]|jgi:tetratricopeptide (TPR) repeat protein|nr:hypothetical protein [Candidatus Cryptobacteroides sp.]MEE0340524.1 hypothetical protein [Bacteroidales bacterium]